MSVAVVPGAEIAAGKALAQPLLDRWTFVATRQVDQPQRADGSTQIDPKEGRMMSAIKLQDDDSVSRTAQPHPLSV